jgi:putative membrane protein insertion efficiency factor
MSNFHSILLTLPQRFLMALVRTYRLLLSPWLGSSCRFEPTCSAYSLQALEIHGATVGTYLTLKRLVRCNPLCAGGHDPVPPRTGSLFVACLAGASQPAATLSSPPTDKIPS